METISQEDFDRLVLYTLRFDLVNGMVLRYPVDATNRAYVLDKLYRQSGDGAVLRPLNLVWFQTASERLVIISPDAILKVTCCIDYKDELNPFDVYYDNFKLLEKETLLQEQETKDGELKLHVVEDEYLPQAIILHQCKAPDDLYEKNPMLYDELENGWLVDLIPELEGDEPLRQFLHLPDNDGEESFVAMKQIMVMEVDARLVFPPDEDDAEFNGFEDGHDAETGNPPGGDLPF